MAGSGVFRRRCGRARRLGGTAHYAAAPRTATPFGRWRACRPRSYRARDIANRAGRRAAMRRRTHAVGLTLLELLAALAIAALLLVLLRAGLPRMDRRSRAARSRGGAGVRHGLRARRGDQAQQRRVNLCHQPTACSARAAGGWETGWLVYADDQRQRRARRRTRQSCASQGAARPGITVRGNRPVEDYVSYNAVGQTRMINGALQMGTFTVCRSGQKAVDVILANGGRVRVSRTGRRMPLNDRSAAANRPSSARP